ncbi:MAG: hypothetical protein E6K77_07835 [Candidatus Eisenbacteria bacterium]|uniref:Roadblock/LC7 domain-containing protein n=1 Tax=Eiseniibacteriota bacterium TaxID=2212470 RepID=A0A538TFG5_UNCEI|nr:MAG: hypothetical protein E6K77_07835 [Candidatus Eisenbacteria bacterium]
MVKGNWALFEEDFWAINTILQSLIQTSSSKSVMLIDKTGQLISSIGEPPGFDVTQGTNESMYLSLIANRVILVVLFDRKTSLGLVRLKARRGGEELLSVLNKLFDKLQYKNEEISAATLGAEFTAEAESEIDSLFKE